MTIETDRTCPTCARNGIVTLMVQVTPKAWICPVQRDEEKRVSEKTKASVRVTAATIDAIAGF